MSQAVHIMKSIKIGASITSFIHSPDEQQKCYDCTETSQEEAPSPASLLFKASCSAYSLDQRVFHQHKLSTPSTQLPIPSPRCVFGNRRRQINRNRRTTSRLTVSRPCRAGQERSVFTVIFTAPLHLWELPREVLISIAKVNRYTYIDIYVRSTSLAHLSYSVQILSILLHFTALGSLSLLFFSIPIGLLMMPTASSSLSFRFGTLELKLNYALPPSSRTGAMP